MALSEKEELELLSLEREKAQSVAAPATQADPSIPTLEGVRADQKRGELAKKNMPLGERLGNVAHGAISGGLANLAAVPVLGGAGKALTMAPKAFGSLGPALSSISKGMGKQGVNTLAKEGAVIGGAITSVVDPVVEYLQNNYRMSEGSANALANSLVMALPVGPLAVKAAWDKAMPTLAGTYAKDIVRRVHGSGTDMITSMQQSDAVKKLLGQFGVGESGADAKAVAAALETASGQRAGAIRGEAATRGTALEAEQAGRVGTIQGDAAAKIARMQSDQAAQSAGVQAKGDEATGALEKKLGWVEKIRNRMPGRAERSRVANLGQDVPPSDLTDAMRARVTPLAQHKEKALADTGEAGWKAMEAEDATKTAAGQFINENAKAQAAKAAIDDLIEPDIKGVRKVSAKSEIYKKLVDWRERIWGDVVEPKGAAAPTQARINAAKNNGIIAHVKAALGLSDADLKNLVANKSLKGTKHAYSSDNIHKALTQEGGGYARYAENDPDDLVAMIADELGASANGANQAKHFPDNADWDAINYKPAPVGQPEIRRASMQSYDEFRRYLDDIANQGPEAAGYSKILSLKARDASNNLREALDEHLPQTFKKAMSDYEDQAKVTGRFRTPVAKSLITPDRGVNETAAHAVPGRVFAGRNPAQELKHVMGDDPAHFDEVGLRYISSELKGLSAEKARAFMKGAYRDWEGELSPAAQGKVKQYMADLEKSERITAGGEQRGKERAAAITTIRAADKATIAEQERNLKRDVKSVGRDAKADIEGGRGSEIAKELRALPGETESRVAESTKQLLGGKKPVDRMKDLITTPLENKEEMRAVFDALRGQPGGKDAFKRAVESVIREQGMGSDAKNIVKLFDNRIADSLVAAGTHTPAEIAKLRSLVEGLEGLANAKVASPADYRQMITEAANTEAMKGAAIGAVIGGLAGGSAMGGFGAHGMIGGALGGAEALGWYVSKSAMVRNEKRIGELIAKIVSDKELFEAAIAPKTDGSVRKLMGKLSTVFGDSGKVAPAMAEMEREDKARRRRAAESVSGLR